MQAIGKVNVLDHAALMAEPNRMRTLPALEPQALRIDVGLAVRGNGDAIDVDAAVDTDQHHRLEATLARPNLEALLVLLEIHRAGIEQQPIGVERASLATAAFFRACYTRRRNPAKGHRKKR